MGDSSHSGLAPSRHLEVERKFDVAESAVAPSFCGLAAIVGVTRAPMQTLDAVYYDTPDLDLAVHHITLRRRTGGTDAGWHLKLPSGPDARTEVRTGLGHGRGDDVPVELRDVVLAIVRDRPLVPTARIATSRTVDVLYGGDGTAVAEFCDDHVIASADGEDTEQRWREWELELDEDAVGRGVADEQLLARLSSRLQEAGGAPARHASKLARVLGPVPSMSRPARGADDSVHGAVAQHVEALLTWERAVRADVEDSVHEMRVALRTIRSLLQASMSTFGLSDDAGILDELRELAGVLGTARDAEVLASRYQRALDELPDDLVHGPVRERLVGGAHERYRVGWRNSMGAMRSERYFRLLDALDGLIAAELGATAVDEKQQAAATIADGYKRVRKRVKAAANTDDVEHHAEALHAIRKSAKRLRYTAAAAGAEQVSEAAKTIQTLLGDHHDSIVGRAYLTEQTSAAHAAGEDTFTHGLLHQREADRAHQCEQQLPAAVKALDTAVGAARHPHSGRRHNHR